LLLPQLTSNFISQLISKLVSQLISKLVSHLISQLIFLSAQFKTRIEIRFSLSLLQNSSLFQLTSKLISQLIFLRPASRFASPSAYFKTYLFFNSLQGSFLSSFQNSSFSLFNPRPASRFGSLSAHFKVHFSTHLSKAHIKICFSPQLTSNLISNPIFLSVQFKARIERASPQLTSNLISLLISKSIFLSAHFKARIKIQLFPNSFQGSHKDLALLQLISKFIFPRPASRFASPSAYSKTYLFFNSL
jgi:hypothetical protein